MSRLPVSLAAAAASLGLSLATTAVLANPASHDPRSIEVEYGDLDLSDSRDAATLYGRIKAAAHDACDAADPRDLRASRRRDECVARAILGAVTRVDRPTLTALHQARASRSRRA
jgi:UrcA family protein